MPEKRAVGTTATAEAGEESIPETAVPGPAAEDEWDRKNLRRSQLISKEFAAGLTQDEEEELNELQAELESELDAMAPISFKVVDDLAAVVRRVEARHHEPTPPDGGSRV